MDLIKEATQFKLDGNDLFGKNQLDNALQKYFKSLEILNSIQNNDDIINKSRIDLEISVNNNISLIYFKLTDYKQSIKYAQNVLNIDNNNIKALIRRGQSSIYQNNNDNLKQLISARKDFKNALKSNKNNNNSKYFRVINKSLKIVNNKINYLQKMKKLTKKQKLYSSFFDPKPTPKINLFKIGYSSNINCICSMYASDYYKNNKNNNNNNNSVKFRLSPFDVTYKIISNNKNVSSVCNVSELVCFDESSKIAYFHLGSSISSSSMYFETTSFLWPKEYTLIFWLKWEKDISLITSFDSGSNAPLYVDKNHIGCAAVVKNKQTLRNLNWNTIKDYEINPAEDLWNFVCVKGGNNKSEIYIGNIDNNLPKYIGYVHCDISGEITTRIGNINKDSFQGPGKVASILIFDGYLNQNEIKNIYYQSLNEITIQWTNKEINQIKQLILNAIKLPVIVPIILDYIRYHDF